MTCLPATGGPALGLALLGLCLLLAGLALAFPRRSARAAGGMLLVLAVLTASTLTPTEAHAATGSTSQDCPAGTGGATDGDGDDLGEGDGEGAHRYDVTYAAGTGGTIDGSTSQRVRAGRDATPVTAVPDAAHTFAAWSDGVTTARRHDRDITDDLQVSATFAPRRHTLTYAAGPGGTLGGDAQQQVDHGTSGTAVSAVPDAGYRFVRWSDGSTANPRTDTDVTADRSVTAEFSAVTHHVTYAAGTGGSITGDRDQTVAHGTDATAVTAVPDAGRHFVRWSDGSTANPRTDGNVVADLAVTAEFAVNVYDRTYVAGPGGTVTGDLDQQVEHGDDATTVTAVPGPEHDFVRWSDGSTANPRTDTNVTANATLTAVFALHQYVLSYLAGTGGSVSPSAPQSVEHGADGTSVTATPDAGYRFVRWSDGSTANPRTDTDVTADLSVTAEFALRTYDLAYTAGSGGSIGGTTPQIVQHGTDGTSVSAVPDVGHHFVRWSDGSTANPRTDTDVTADLSVTAEFAVTTYRVRYLAGTGGSVTGDDDQSVDHGTDTTPVTAVADTGYFFVQWSDGSTANPRTDVAVVADLSVTAEFADALPLAVRGVHRAELANTAPHDISIRNPDGAEAEYLLVPTNTGSQSTPVSVAISGNAPLTAATPPVSTEPADPHSVARTAAVAQAEARRGGVGPGTPLVPPAQLPTGVPAVGDTMTLNRDPSSACTTGTAVTATVREVGTHVVVVSDSAQPVGGFVAADYEDLREALDSAIGGVTDLLGDTSDLDQNGRVVVFVTPSMNALDPPASSAMTYARYRPSDLLDQTECKTSNVGEVFYALAPDPTGSVNSNVRTVSSTLGNIPPAVAHELGHQIVDAAHLDAGTPLDGTWLSEAIADTALDGAFYAASVGMQPLQNIVVTNLTTGPNASRRVAAFNTFANQNYGRYRPWLQRTTGNPIMAATPSLASRGGAWAFLSYLADRKAQGSLSGRTAFLRSLVDGPGTGTATLTAALGGSPTPWLEEFAVAAFTDDQVDAGPLGATGPYAMLSWNYRSLYTALNGAYQLGVGALDADTSTSSTYAAQGGARHLLFRIAGGATATLTLTASQAGATVGYRIVRLR